MAQNSSTNPATAGNTTIAASTGADQLSGGGGNDTINGLAGNDRLSGDLPLPGQWQYSVYDRNFADAPNQTSLIGDAQSTLIGRGYVDDFNAEDLRNTLGGTPTTLGRNDFGVIYRSGLQITTGGTYTFSTRSDDGSRIIIKDASGAEVFNLNNDDDQGATTREGTVILQPGLYSIDVFYWENAGVTAMSGTIAGPGLPRSDLATSPLITTPPLAPGHVEGNDSLVGGTGNDTITGDGGNDRLFGGADQDSILGGTGNDYVEGGSENDTIDGGVGDDSLAGDSGADSIFGDAGDDSIGGGSGNDTLLGGAGNDRVLGDAGSDSIDGGAGNDSVDAGSDNDTVFGSSVGSGDDSIDGGSGDDSLMFGDGHDTVLGGLGNDVIDDVDGGELSGANLLFGGDGNDRIWAGFGNDTIYGDADNDRIFGEAGDDSLFGGFGNDSLFGGSGNDRLYGGSAGNTAGEIDGNDLFLYNAGDVETLTGNATESVFGGGGEDSASGDFDVLDVTGLIQEFGWKRVIIVETAAEDGRVEILDAPGGNVIATIYFDNIEDYIRCFTPGTLILTDRGEVAVETLVAGDLVMTRDNGMQPLRWVGRRHLSRARLASEPALQPVRIAKDAMSGEGPVRAMLVSPQHRVLVEGARAELLFGAAEVLVPARHLVGRAEVTRVLPEAGVTYIHLLFDRHEILQSDGIWTESFQPAERMLNAMEAEVRDEILAIFPELASDAGAFEGARISLKAHEAQVLLAP